MWRTPVMHAGWKACARPVSYTHLAELLEGINEHVASEDADKKLGNEERQAAEQPFLGEQRRHDAEMVEQQREPRERGDEQRGLRAAQALSLIHIFL